MRPSRVIHPTSTRATRRWPPVPDLVGTVDILLGNLEDGVRPRTKIAAREGLLWIGRAVDFGSFTQF